MSDLSATTDLPASLLIQSGAAQTMSSREIADLTGKRHDHVLRDIRTTLVQLYGDDEVQAGVPSRDIFEVFFTRMGWGIDSPKLGNERIQGIKVRRDDRGFVGEISLDYPHTMTLISGYSVRLRKSIIDEWEKLKAATNTLSVPDFANPAAAARAWADQYEARLIAERTKAEIGTRREATAMNTASQAVRTANKLRVELDRSHEYATIKRMTMLYHGQEFQWRMLKHVSAEMGLPPIDVFDQNYGTVKSYHAAVWREAYALEIELVRRDDEPPDRTA